MGKRLGMFCLTMSTRAAIVIVIALALAIAPRAVWAAGEHFEDSFDGGEHGVGTIDLSIDGGTLLSSSIRDEKTHPTPYHSFRLERGQTARLHATFHPIDTAFLWVFVFFAGDGYVEEYNCIVSSSAGHFQSTGGNENGLEKTLGRDIDSEQYLRIVSMEKGDIVFEIDAPRDEIIEYVDLRIEGYGSSPTGTTDVLVHITFEDEQPISIFQSSDTEAREGPGAMISGFVSQIVEGVTEGDIPTLLGVAGVTIVGIASIGAIGSRISRGKKPAPSRTVTKKAKPAQDKQPQKKEEEKPKKQYRMVAFKDFGNKLCPGASPRIVRVRIEESADGVTYAPNWSMTNDVKAIGLHNLNVTDAGMMGVDKVVRVSVFDYDMGLIEPSGASHLPVLRLAFTGAGGSFVNDIQFKLAMKPKVVFLDTRTGATCGENRIDVDLIIGDGTGSPLRFAVVNLLARPERLTITPSAADVSETHEERPDPKRPDDYVYQACLSNDIQPQSPYGTWPLERTITIIASNADERVEATVRARLWPEGFFFDTRSVPARYVLTHPDRILVDTSSVEVKGYDVADSQLAEVRLSLGVSVRDGDGVVTIDRPTLPEGVTLYRLQAKGHDEASARLLSAEDPRFWYDLTLLPKPASEASDPRLGSLVLTPFFPIVTKQPNTVFKGTRPLMYRTYRGTIKGQIDFDLTGLSYADVYTQDRREIIANITKLLAGRQYHDMVRIRQIFEQRGAEALPLLDRLGPREELASAGKNTTALMRELESVLSVARLRLIYEDLYWASYTYCEEDGLEFSIRVGGSETYITTIKWKTVGKIYDNLCFSMQTTRYVCIVALAVCWHLLKKKYAQHWWLEYLEGFLTPLLNYVTEYCGKLSEYVTIETHAGFSIEHMEGRELSRMRTLEMELDDFFSTRRVCSELVIPSIENWVFSFFTGKATSGVTNKEKMKTVAIGLGVVLLPVFIKNFMKTKTFNQKTGRDEYDLWRAVRMTLADISIYTVKVMLAVLIAHKIKAADKALAATQATRKPGMGDYKIVIDEGTFLDDMLLFPINAYRWLADKITWRYEYVHLALKEMGNEGIIETASKGFGALANEGVNVAREEFDPFGDFGAWARSLGSIRMSVLNEGETEPTIMEIPLLTYLYLRLDIIFQKSGFDCLEYLKLDYRSVLPEECPYMPRDQMVEVLDRLGAHSEVAFIVGQGPVIEDLLPPNIGISGSSRFPLQR